MPSLNISFTDEEMERVRALAADSGLALKPYVKDSALQNSHQERLRAITRHIADNSVELYRRLA